MTDQGDLFGEDSAARLPRSPNGVNVHRFMEGFGVKVYPYSEARGWKDRPANVIYGGRTISRLLRKNEAKTALVVRCIQASDATCFDDVVIWSVWQFIGAHFSHSKPVDVISQFQAIDLASIKKRAYRLANGRSGRMGKTAEKISTLLADAMIPKDDAA